MSILAIPKYLEIKEQIIDEIKGKPVNSPISSERDLAIQFDASRMTVRNSINELVEEGYLYREKNKGTFVADKKLIKKNTATEILQSYDSNDYSIIYFSFKNAEDLEFDITPFLELDEEDSRVLRIVRLNKTEGRPSSVEEVYFIKSFVSDEDVKNLRNLLNLNHLIVNGSVTQRFHPVIIPAQYANLLKLKINIPVIMIESTIRSMNGKPLVYIRAYNNPFEKTIEITS
ncbi:MAG: GntR family transcriptional regulator [Longicatena sp.]|uniref:GntR family transcriptional regulator n=1 Tax=Anaerorhabdus sp. TaxID=1872524 RepID=UPI002FC6DBDF